MKPTTMLYAKVRCQVLSFNENKRYEIDSKKIAKPFDLCKLHNCNDTQWTTITTKKSKQKQGRIPRNNENKTIQNKQYNGSLSILISTIIHQQKFHAFSFPRIEHCAAIKLMSRGRMNHTDSKRNYMLCLWGQGWGEKLFILMQARCGCCVFWRKKTICVMLRKFFIFYSAQNDNNFATLFCTFVCDAFSNRKYAFIFIFLFFFLSVCVRIAINISTHLVNKA